MAWSQPKTDWYGATDSEGVYTGDRFNAVDFNRIKNNLSYLRDLAITLYDEFDIIDVGADRTRSQYPYADEINNLESNLNTINSHTINRPYGSSPIYYDNAAFVNFDELNRLESAILDLYNRLTNQSEGRRMFTWNFGMKGGTL